MSTMRLRQLAVAVMVSTVMAPFPVQAQTSGMVSAGSPMLLAASFDAAALDHSRLLTQTPVASPGRRSCKKSLATGLAIGAGAGLAVGGGLLAATGGSDSTYRILFTFTGLGAGIGGLIGGSACSK